MEWNARATACVISHCDCRSISDTSVSLFSAGFPPSSQVRSSISPESGMLLSACSTKVYLGAWEQYSENYCFVQNTYFLPLHHYIPKDLQEREDREIGTTFWSLFSYISCFCFLIAREGNLVIASLGYYQWVPFVLGLQAILFYLPSLIWRIFNWQSGACSH